MKEYDRWTKQWYDAKLQQSARDLGDSVCVGWRSSFDCNPNGRRQPELDRGCGAVIRANSHNGGYCECNREAGIAPVFIGCRHRAFTCKQVCSPLFKLETLELSRGEELQAPEAELVKLNAETNSETAIRSQVEHERQSSREFGLAHLRAVDAARQLRERSTLHEAKYETNGPSQQRERLLGAAIANAFGKHRTPAQVQTIGAENAQGEEIPYRLPDALIDKEKEDQYYRYLDRIQSEHEKKKRAEVIAEDDKDRL
ncbi:Hypothetical protein, putative [Bodo saltans]|uniref:Uncharacterized protein n=1 Tax=Bodo saltans TaxID=75058 RepID=A0A0S4JCY3_BODSA|nr:Hypothetical protein, putative [Bodo saltans]|eukprot:CUG87943.1 Hypothetical protein, putative [Bodo saltans]